MKFSDIKPMDEINWIKKGTVIVEGKRLARICFLFLDKNEPSAMCIYILRRTFKPSGRSSIFSIKLKDIILN